MTPEAPQVERRWWDSQGRTDGVSAWAAAGVLLALGAAWLAWPLLAPATAPSYDDLTRIGGWLVAALAALVGVLGACLWRESGGRGLALAPAICLAIASGALRLLAVPASGVDVSGVPLLCAGLVAGGPAGVFAGGLAGLVCSLASGAPDYAAPAATLAGAAWGLAGSWLRGLAFHRQARAGVAARGVAMMAAGSIFAARAAAVVIAAYAAAGTRSLGVWPLDLSAASGAFDPTLRGRELVERAVGYIVASPLWRQAGVTAVVSVVTLAASGGLIRALGLAFGVDGFPVAPDDRAARLRQRVIRRRQHTDRFTDLWSMKEHQ